MLGCDHCGGVAPARLMRTSLRSIFISQSSIERSAGIPGRYQCSFPGYDQKALLASGHEAANGRPSTRRWDGLGLAVVTFLHGHCLSYQHHSSDRTSLNPLIVVLMEAGYSENLQLGLLDPLD